MNAQEQVLQIYQQSVANLETDAPDVVDEVIVALFETVKRQQQQLAELTLKVSLLEDHDDTIIGEETTSLIDKLKQPLH